ncbi:DUF2844 domain-containing protein [Paraburkholderia aromaticivorans]|uniref:DUF2844 domain-containing protein n=1 Tax=Paraburkholderia aromaticivorans TaxID=2026199 RepID=A0A248VXJ5_9BURK|nr:DUF2844 domain-containing protein [Paraburkholderia aromaticivorans]ASW03766.1 hypothetical protein CJU94_36880 [Paraburkholderia aromaticivorans]
MKKKLLAMATTACCSISTLAYASLGGSIPTVSDDQVRLVANHQAVNQQATAGAGYTVSEMVLPSKTVVREYVAGGKVFAVTWSGPSAPNVRQLLGAYVDQASADVKAFREAHGGIGPVSVSSGDFVFQSGGHMGFYAGRAYIPSAIPSGVTSSDIR